MKEKSEFQKNLLNQKYPIIRIGDHLKNAKDKMKARNIKSLKGFDRKRYKIKLR